MQQPANSKDVTVTEPPVREPERKEPPSREPERKDPPAPPPIHSLRDRRRHRLQGLQSGRVQLGGRPEVLDRRSTVVQQHGCDSDGQDGQHRRGHDNSGIEPSRESGKAMWKLDGSYGPLSSLSGTRNPPPPVLYDQYEDCKVDRHIDLHKRLFV